MDDNDIEYAVKLYKKKKGSRCTIEEFARDIQEHKSRRSAPNNTYDSFLLYSSITKLWNILEMSMRELVEYSKLDMAKFSRRFCIPYRTLQAWCDGTNECPVYIKLMIAEIYKLYSRAE